VGVTLEAMLALLSEVAGVESELMVVVDKEISE